MRLCYIIIAVICCLIQNAGRLMAQIESKWVSCHGEAVVNNIPYEEAQLIALRRARLNAIEEVCGVLLQSETMVKNFIFAGDFIHAISHGNIIEEKNNPPVINLIVEMQAKVIPDMGKPDPYFKIDLKLNRTTFLSHDEVILNVKATKDCYITVFNLAANDSIYVLFPNKWQGDNFIVANKNMEIPDQQYREDGLHIRVANLPGHKKDTEIVKVIATKQRIDLLTEFDNSSGFGLMGTPRMAVTKIARLLSEIPISERAEASAIYTVETK